jgi:hypothetical protein
MLSGILVSMTRILMIFPPFMTPLKKTTNSDTLTNMYCHRTVATHHICLEEEFYDAREFIDFDEQVDDLLDTIHPDIVRIIYGIHSSKVSKVAPNFDLLCPLFGWAPADTIKRTFAVTTQYPRGRVSDTIK